MPVGSVKPAPLDDAMGSAFSREKIPVTHASVAVVYDRGEEIWILLGTNRPGIGSPDREDDVETVADRWIVLPRSGAVTLLHQAVELLRIDGPPRRRDVS